GLTDSKNSNIEEKNEISDDIQTVRQNSTSILEEKNNIQVLNNDNNENKSSVEGTEYEDIGSENAELKAVEISPEMLHMTPGNDLTRVTSDYESDSGGSVFQVSELSDPSLTYIHHRPPVLSDQGSPLPTLEQT